LEFKKTLKSSVQRQMIIDTNVATKPTVKVCSFAFQFTISYVLLPIANFDRGKFVCLLTETTAIYCCTPRVVEMVLNRRFLKLFAKKN